MSRAIASVDAESGERAGSGAFAAEDDIARECYFLTVSECRCLEGMEVILYRLFDQNES